MLGVCCVEEDLSADVVQRCAKDFELEFGALSQANLKNLRRKQRQRYQKIDLEITSCDVKKLMGAGFSKTFAERIYKNKHKLFLQEDLIETIGMWIRPYAGL